MPTWTEDLSACSLEEVIRSQAENRAWNKQLRLKKSDLVNNRLAKRIDQDEYTLNRKLAHEEAAECKRRATILVNEIESRTRQEA